MLTMSEVEPRRAAGSRFSLGHLLTFTALMAVGIAVGLAYLKNRSLTKQLDELNSLSSRLIVTNEKELALAAMPSVADDFQSWQVHVPEGRDYELRLGIGAVSERDIPPIVGSVRIPAGQHRVTLYKGATTSEKFRYDVYVDGVAVIEKTMGSDWIPGGWSSASSVSWPRGPSLSSAPLQLTAQGYEPKTEFGSGNYFNRQSDNYVTRLGFRLWIDQADLTYEAGSPFIGFPEDPQVYAGIGLRDGLRYRMTSSPYEWTFIRPKFATTDSAFRIEAEFFADDGTSLTSQSQSFQAWQIRNAATGTETLRWQDVPSQTTQSAFLHAVSKTGEGLQPVIELKWDAGKPDEVGIRLAETPANDQISRWRLRILDGSHHLWRQLKIGDHPSISPNDVSNGGKVELGNEVSANFHLRWQTDETLPLQIVERNDKRYFGMGLFRGLPLRLGIQIPASLKPSLTVDVAAQHPSLPETAFPKGSVFNEIDIEFAATEQDWIWLSAEEKK